MAQLICIFIAAGVVFWILWPLWSAAIIEPDQISTDSSLEQRYAQAMLDLESDLLGGRLSDAEFERRRQQLQTAYEAQQD